MTSHGESERNKKLVPARRCGGRKGAWASRRVHCLPAVGGAAPADGHHTTGKMPVPPCPGTNAAPGRGHGRPARVHCLPAVGGAAPADGHHTTGKMPVPPCLAWIGLAWALLTTTSSACQVPVFRYALERWNADNYRMVALYHDGDDVTDSLAAMRSLQAAGANLEIDSLNLSTLTDAADVAGRGPPAKPDRRARAQRLFPRPARTAPARSAGREN